MDGTPTPAGGTSRVRLYIAIGAVILAAIFILQNSQKVAVKFFFSETETPLIFALLFAAGLGFVIGLALPRFRSGSKRD
ncbi:MAG: LapA family protein [Actinomycetota bacterium]|nr:LapA family protein [Actinomycetota bacterium]